MRVDFEQVRNIAFKHMKLKKGLHGFGHIERVVEYAKLIAKKECPGKYEDIIVGAYLHDVGRIDDSENNEHALKSAEIAEFLISRHWPWLDKKKIVEAIKYHADGDVTDDHVIGAIWDADRLDLDRIGKVIDCNLLSTKTAKKILSKKSG